jgi:hypothetical protein
VPQFYSSAFMAAGPWMAWDGSNTEEVIAWLDAFPVTQNQDTWTGVVVDGQLVLTGSPYMGEQLPLPAGVWLTLGSGSGRNTLTTLMPEDQWRYWQTVDPSGKPTDLAELIGEEPPPTPEQG